MDPLVASSVVLVVKVVVLSLQDDDEEDADDGLRLTGDADVEDELFVARVNNRLRLAILILNYEQV